jgi:hypothetical protein
MWVFKKSEEERIACLQISNGNTTSPRASPVFRNLGANFSDDKDHHNSYGAFQFDDDKQGYTLEYRVRWEDVWSPKPVIADGSEHEICWDVRWSDQAGTKLLAKLSDVLDPVTPRRANLAVDLSCENPKFWGKAMFHK